MEKALGNIIKVECDLSKPTNIQINTFTPNSLTILVGQNGTGKTFLNKVIYFASFVAYVRISNSFAFIKGDTEKEKIQFVFDHTFTSPKELSGFIKVQFENGSFQLRIDEGNIYNGLFTCDDEVNSASNPKYMSTETRLFTNIEKILRLNKALDNDGVLEYYKIYDFFHCYNLYIFAKFIKLLPTELSNVLKESYEIDLVELDYNDETCEFFGKSSTGDISRLNSLSSGYQSLINMHISASI